MSTVGPNTARLGNYLVNLNHEIGKGGVATVYHATHIYMERPAAVKVIHHSIRSTSPDAPTVLGDEDVQIELSYEKRFHFETTLLASLKHPKIVQIFEAGLTELSLARFGMHQPYFIMPYLPFNLAKLTSGKRLPFTQILMYAEQIARALDYAYLEKGIVHRDVKPSNVLVESDEKTVFLSDFGSALLTTAADTSAVLIGTWPYAAPEQIVRAPGTRGYSHTTDQFSLAVMVYQWFCSVKPIDFTKHEDYYDLYKGQNYRLPSFAEKGVTDIDPYVENVVRKALSLKPEDRFDTNMDFVEALRSAAERQTRRTPQLQQAESEESRKQQERIDSLVGQLRQAKQRTQDLEAQVKDELAKQLRLDDFITQQRNQLVEANRRIDELIDQQEQAEHDRAEWQAEQARLTHTQRRIDELETLLAELKNSFQTQEAEVKQLQLRLQRANQRVQTLSVEKANLEQQLSQATRQPKRTIHSLTHPALRTYILSIVWSPDGRFLAVASAFGARGVTVQVIEALTGKQVITYKDKGYRIAWSPDGRYLASGSPDSTIRVFEALTGTQVLTYKGHISTIQALAWSPDGKYLAAASGSTDDAVRVIEALTGKQVLTYKGHTHIVYAVVWSPDGRYLASASWDTTVQVIEALTGKQVLTYSGHEKEVHTVAWSPDGNYLASAGSDRTVRVFEALTGTQVLTYKGHTGTVDAVAWSPDGYYLASSSYDTVRVCEALSGRQILTYKGHDCIVHTVAWSPDGNYLASEGSHDTIQVLSIAEYLEK